MAPIIRSIGMHTCHMVICANYILSTQVYEPLVDLTFYVYVIVDTRLDCALLELVDCWIVDKPTVYWLIMECFSDIHRRTELIPLSRVILQSPQQLKYGVWWTHIWGRNKEQNKENKIYDYYHFI